MGRQLFRAARREAGRLAYDSVCSFLSRRPTCSLSTDSVESVVVLGLVKSSFRCSCGVHPRAQPLTLAHARPLEQLRCEIPQRGELAPRPEVQSKYRKPPARDVMRSETTSRRMLALNTCVASEESERQLRDEWREAQARLARHVAESNAYASARERMVRHASMDCSQPDLRSLGLLMLPRSHAAFDVVGLAGLSTTPPQDVVSVKAQNLRECIRLRAHQEGLLRTSHGNPCGSRPATISTNTGTSCARRSGSIASKPLDLSR